MGYEDRYSVSDHGRVRVNATGQVLRDFKQCGKKYRRVNLYDASDKLRQWGVHQLVARAFLGEPPAGHVVNHIDADPTNNRLSNLEYLTQRGNCRHAAALGLLAQFPGESNPMARLRVDMVMDIKWLIAGGFSNSQVAGMYDVSAAAIQAIRAGKTWPNVPMGPWSPELADQYELQGRLDRPVPVAEPPR